MSAAPIVRVTRREGLRGNELRVRVEILDVARFQAEVGDRLTLELLKVIAALDLLFGLLDAGTDVVGDSDRAFHSRRAVTLMAMGVLVELASHLKTLPKTMRSEGLDMPELRTIEGVCRRWRDNNMQALRHHVSFHYDEETIRRGLRKLASTKAPVLLVDDREGLPCFGAGITALLAGLSGFDDANALLMLLLKDTTKIGHAVSAVIGKVVVSKGLEADVIDERPLVLR